jgi:hypothetical protein
MNVEVLTDDQAVEGYDYPIEIKVYSAGVQLKPSSATIVIKDSDGDEILASTAMTVNGTTGTMTYTLALAKLDTLWENALIEIEYTVSSVKYRAVFFFDCVLNALKCNVTDTDLKAYAPLLADQIWSTETNYSTQILEAFRQVARAIKDKGRRPHMLIDGNQVRELVILRTLEMICFDFSKASEDIWWNKYQKYHEAFEAAFAKLIIKYDEDESGAIDTDEEEGLGQIDLLR